MELEWLSIYLSCKMLGISFIHLTLVVSIVPSLGLLIVNRALSIPI